MGLDLGLEQAGFETLAFVELDPVARQTIHINLSRLGRNAVIFEDVTQVTAQDLLEATKLQAGEITLVSGGPPCQPFSTAGRRAAIQDPRGSLFRDFIRLIEGIRPRFFVMENVRGILSAAIRHRPIAERGKEARPLDPDELPGSAFQVILDEFTRLGYTYAYGLLNAANYGVPQIRERVIIIGSRDHEPIALPQPTHSQSGIGLPKWRTLREALANLSDPEPLFPPYPDSRLRFLQLIPEGGNWRNLPRELLPEAMGGALNSGGGKVGFYRRLAWDKPSPTITTSPAQKATDMCHPSELRPISVREAARIQGFPDDWIFYGSMADQYRQIGNAVPPRLGKAIGDSIVATIMGEKKATAIQTRLFELAS